MKNIVIFVLALYLFEVSNAFSCFHDPWMLSSSPCGCALSSSCTGPFPTAYPYSPTCPCYRNPCNVCEVCVPPSPTCQCTQCDCGCKTPIYFPEVEYPLTIIDMNPFMYSVC